MGRGERRIFLWLLATTLLLVFIFTQFSSDNGDHLGADRFKATKLRSHRTKSEPHNLSALPITTIFDTCPLPYRDPWDPEVMRLFNPAERLPFHGNCTPTGFDVTFHKNGVVYVNEDIALEHDFKCRQRCLLPVDDYTSARGNWTPIDGRIRMPCDLIEAECTSRPLDHIHTRVYQQIHEISLPKLSSSSAPKDSVYMIIVDSLSHTNAERSIPQTLSYLRETFDLFSFPWLQRTGENSRPNAWALFNGKSIVTADRSIFGDASLPGFYSSDEACEKDVMNETFIAFDYERAGYVTFMAEDFVLAIFNWVGCIGFTRTPTHHYNRPLRLSFDPDLYTTIDRMYESLTKEQCKEMHSYLLEHTTAFIQSYKDQPKFGITWITDLGHSHLVDVAHADGDFVRFFRENRDELDRSWVFFLADHGMRFGDVVDTKLGQVERNNPMLHIIVPKRYRSNARLRWNLEQNAAQILSQLDVHQTLMDIISLNTEPFLEEDEFTFAGGDDTYNAYSLLRPFPKDSEARSCRNMPIPFQFCVCDLARDPIEDPSLFAAFGREATVYLNQKIFALDVKKRCARLTFQKTHAIQRIRHSILYEVTFFTQPNGGKFRAIMRMFPNGTIEAASETIERVNEYASQSKCIDDQERLRPLCYCILAHHVQGVID